MTTSLLRDAFAHHLWATERLIEACTALTPEQLSTLTPGTFGSIIATFRHLVEADSLYRSVLTGASLLPIDEEASLAVLQARMTENGSVWMEFLAGQLDPEIAIVEHDQGWEFHVPLGIRLAQVIHHGTDHRSQICTALTNLGLSPPELDVWAFAQAAGRERAVPPATP